MKCPVVVSWQKRKDLESLVSYAEDNAIAPKSNSRSLREKKAHSLLVKYTDINSDHFDLAVKTQLSYIRKSWFADGDTTIKETGAVSSLPIGIGLGVGVSDNKKAA